MTGWWVNSAFKTCGLTGLGMAIAAALVLASHTGMSLRLILFLALAGMLSSYAVLLATKIAIGAERWVFYHHAIAAAAGMTLLLVSLRQPVLAYLDVAAIGLLILLACGRAGCLLVGCCHGRPSDWGVRYGSEHVAAGFPRDLAGVRLTPVQAAESLWVMVVVAVGGRMVWNWALPGAALAWCLIAYGGGRFLLELGRGDRDRRCRWGLREAQWTSLALVVFAVAAQAAGLFPRSPWQLATAFAWTAFAGATWLYNERRPRLQAILAPDHVRELALAVDRVHRNDAVVVERTSLGVRISGAALGGPKTPLRFYTVSSDGTEMDAHTALVVARLVRRLRHPRSRIELVTRQPGVFHLVLSDPETAERSAVGKRADFRV
jgi:prolipoprotein diacylglyceryltransferase